MDEFLPHPVIESITQDGDTQTTRLRHDLTGTVWFTWRMPFWARVKVLFGWNPRVAYALDGTYVRVGAFVSPDWWPIDELCESDEVPCK